MIADYKEETRSLLTRVSQATQNFRPINRLKDVSPLPAPLPDNILSFSKRALNYETKLGYEVMAYECGAESATAYALIIFDGVTRDLAGRNAPAAREKLQGFLKLYPEASRDNQRALWLYLTSTYSLCNRARDEAAARLKQAQSFETAGKKKEALREYREINGIYPNPVTAAKIRQLEDQSR